MDQIVPKLDVVLLQQKADEAAMKGAISAIEEYYTGYNSPYKKALNEYLAEKSLSIHFDLPDIVGVLNDKLKAEIDNIANKAMAETLIPRLSKILARADKKIKFSDILKEYYQAYVSDCDSKDSFEVSIVKHEYGWLRVKLTCECDTTELTLHENKKSEYRSLLSLPYSGESRGHTSIKNDVVTIKLPFSSDLLSNDFNSYCARLIIAESEIEMDCDSFDDIIESEDL